MPSRKKSPTDNLSISVIVTTYNEAITINDLLLSLVNQSLKPAEITITDNLSIDGTDLLIKKFAKNHQQVPIKLISKHSNRSLGRNLAIHKASSKLIAITDAGCVPQQDWLEQLQKTYLEKKAELSTDKIVIAGYYRGKANTAFEQAVIPYALVMPERVDPNKFLPATRSMLLPKSVWVQLNGFDEKLNFSEDFHFARRLRKNNIAIVFAKDAIVDWLPKKTWWEFCTMIFNMARADVLANTWRPKVALVFLRYLLWFAIWWLWPMIAIVLLIAYIIWSIAKNYRYTPEGWYFLPLLQFSADAMVMLGTIIGILEL